MRVVLRDTLLLFEVASCGVRSSGNAPMPPQERGSASATMPELVYAAVLDTLIGPGALAVVAESTSGNWHAEGLAASSPPGFESAGVALASAPGVLPPLPRMSQRVVLVTGATFGALAHATPAGLRDPFGKNAVLMRLSAVGLSADTAHAVVATDTWCGDGSVESELLFLVRSPEGRWNVTQRSPLYIDQ
jgi:hypothetical protein